jgi:hypothetical protein
VGQLDESKRAAERELADLPSDERFDVEAALRVIEEGTLAEQRQLVITFIDHIVVERARGRGVRLAPVDRLRLVDRRRALVA